jgi:hypothetical protein
MSNHNVNHTFQVAFSKGFRTITEADRATVSCRLLIDGEPSGADIVLAEPDVTSPEMHQWDRGLFRFQTENCPLVRGQRYRATYTIYLGGEVAETVTQDFTAHSDYRAGTTPASELHDYRLSSLRNIVRRTLGLADNQEPGSADSREIVNDALESLWREHRWQFQVADPVHISFIANQYKYRLPHDFMEVISVAAPSDITTTFSPALWPQIRSLRERHIVSPARKFLYAVVSDQGESLGHRMRYAIEIWPTPGTFVQSAMIVDYYREYPRLLEETDIAPFPNGLHSLVKQSVRMAAMESENDPKAADERLKYERMLAAARDHDGRHSERNLGSLIDEHDMDADSPLMGRHDPYRHIIN